MPRGVLVAGPNLTIDRTAALDELRPGAVLRFERVVVTPGGKGLNVARAARALGVDALLVGFVPGATGRAGAGMIEREGVALRAVECGGELRSTAIVMERDGRTTVFNEPGPEIGVADWEALRGGRRRFAAGARGARLLGQRAAGQSGRRLRAARAAGGGSRPAMRGRRRRRDAGACAGGGARRGLPERGRGGGGRRRERRRRAPRPLRRGRRRRPRRAEAAAAALVARGARGAVVTADAAGAAVADSRGERAWLPAPRIADVRNPVGAGDVFACGLAAAIERGEPLLEAARHGVAAAAASVEWPTAGELDPARAAELLAEVVPAP